MNNYASTAEKNNAVAQHRSDSNFQHVPVAGGVLVFDTDGKTIGKELVGVVEVTDWDSLADALTTRGYSRGTIYHLEELDG